MFAVTSEIATAQRGRETIKTKTIKYNYARSLLWQPLPNTIAPGGPVVARVRHLPEAAHHPQAASAAHSEQEMWAEQAGTPVGHT